MNAKAKNVCKQSKIKRPPLVPIVLPQEGCVLVFCGQAENYHKQQRLATPSGLIKIWKCSNGLSAQVSQGYSEGLGWAVVFSSRTGVLSHLFQRVDIIWFIVSEDSHNSFQIQQEFLYSLRNPQYYPF